jgi:hypothetical protein
VQKARDYNLLHAPEKPLLEGRDLLDSIEPGPRIGTLVREAYQIQINENIRDKELLKKRVLKIKKA